MSAETCSRYVTRNPEILDGEPIIVGTRTTRNRVDFERLHLQ